MAVQSTLYDLETTDIRFFLSTKPIASKSHVAIWIKGDDDVYTITNESEYELINDNIVFPTHPSGKALEVRVGDEPSDILQAPTDIAIVSAISNEIIIVANSVQDVISVSDNIAQVIIVSDNMTELLVISNDVDQILLSKEYAVNPIDVPITDNPEDYSSFHYNQKTKELVDNAQTIVDSVNFPAGLIMEWHTDRKPTGWLWCDGQNYSVFSPSPASAYDELYQVLVDTAYVMTTKPVDWDINYPDDPNGWYDPNFVGSVVTQDELDLLVTVPDRRGLFVRGKDQAGSVIPARGIDTHGVVDFDVIIPSQNKSHSHELYTATRTGDGATDDNNSASPDGMSTLTTSSEGGIEGHGTYTPTNYIIRAKGSYNGDGSGSGGTGVVPIASEVEYSDTYNNGVTNLQESTDDLYFGVVLKKEDVGARDATYQAIKEEASITEFQSLVMLDENFIVYSYHFISNKYYLLDMRDLTIVSLSTLGDANFNNFSYDYENKLLYLPLSSTGEILIWKWDGAILTPQTSLNTTITSADKSVNLLTINTQTVAVWNAGTSKFEVINTTDDSKIYYTLAETIRGAWSLNGRVVLCGLASGLYRELFISDGSLGTEFIPSILPWAVSDSNGWAGETDTDGSVVVRNGDIIYTTIIDLDTLTSTYEIIPEYIIPAVAFENRQKIVSQLGRFGNIIRTYALDNSTTEIVKFYKDPNDRVYSYYNKEQGISGYGKNAYSMQTKDQSSNSGAHFDNSATYGYGTKTGRVGQFAFGEFNIGKTDTLLEVGIGISDITRTNGLEVYESGDVQSPNRLAVPNATSLLTKDIADGLYNLYAPTGFTGTFLIANGDTVTVTDGLIISVAP